MSSGSCADLDTGCNLLHVWDLPQDMFSIARSYIQLRSSLMPYIYTATRTMHDTLLSFLRPMYLDFPKEEDAFTACTIDGAMSQYMFGDDMFIAPVVSPADSTTGLAKKDVWIPPGQVRGSESRRDEPAVSTVSPGLHKHSVARPSGSTRRLATYTRALQK